MKVKQILCPVDFSTGSRRALDEAASLARSHEATLTVLHVHPLIVAGPEVPYLGTGVPLDESSRARLIHRLQEFIAPVQAAGSRLEVKLLEGDPWVVVAEQAQFLPADLIVMGTHGRRGFARWILGSVTERILHTAPCPVLTVSPVEAAGAAPGQRPVLCALDLIGSEDTLEAAASLADSRGVHLVVAHVVEGLPEDALAGPFDVPEYRRYMEEDARAKLHRLVERSAREVTVSEIVVTGRPHDEILRLAEEQGAGLLVIGSHGPKTFERMFVGSTAARVVREAPCPVLTLRPVRRAAAKVA